ncbi:hypothetical protein [aff. Roholtiella sp. LEGE 12411]|uniref:hypothetical protein n=1 Tax=aff. Roholtiella sp. LEGE 12411 TaxID=1828822 RepID=UPI001882B56C|nr:hypothetical protein [aff. Roholtiella sp. LEGE 12411]MBE9038118.1 hypothetical protein [aff. Roholtiella sp. LEGE 12411]
MRLENGIYYSQNLQECIFKSIHLDEMIEKLETPNSKLVNYSCCYTGSHATFKEDLKDLGFRIEDVVGVYAGVGQIFCICNNDICFDMIVKGFWTF